MKHALTRDVSVFGRAVPVFFILLIALAGTGTAALLTMYGTAQGTANVSQAVTLNGNNIEETADGTNTFQALYSYAVSGGELGQGTFTIQNNADQLARISMSSTVTDGPSGDSSTSVADGLDTSHVVYDQWKVGSGDSSYSVTVDAAKEHVTKGDYALHFQSHHGDGNDYARVFYPVDNLENFDRVTYDGVANGDNPVDDELWLVTEDGGQYYLHNGSVHNEGTAVFQLDASLFQDHTGDSPDTLSDVVAIGIGQGAPNAGGYTVDTYIDNVQLQSDSNSASLDEPAALTLDLTPTGNVDGEDITTRYRANVVTDFALNVWPGSYDIETTVAPAN